MNWGWSEILWVSLIGFSLVFILLVALIFIMKAFGACFRVRPASGRKALHDRESEVLTILNIKRAYSPWNSKIHGLTQLPDRR